MIEMLGVLAIIAVLTVGGIAGYSKAMKKYQANKVVGEIIQVLAKWKELSENESLDNIYNLDNETRKTLGLCLPSAENCSVYQRTSVGIFGMMGADQYEGINLSHADPELCISAFNNIAIPLKGNIDRVLAYTYTKDRRIEFDKLLKCSKKCSERWDPNDYFNLGKCKKKCDDAYDESEARICLAENERTCYGGWNYLNLHDARVMTEFSALLNSGFDKKCSLAIDLKKGFFK